LSLPLAIELCKNRITFHATVHKNVPLLFFQQLRETLADFYNLWHVTLKRNLTQMFAVLAISL